MEMPELFEDIRFKDHISRGENQKILDQIIDDWSSTRDVSEVEEIMQEYYILLKHVHLDLMKKYLNV